MTEKDDIDQIIPENKTLNSENMTVNVDRIISVSENETINIDNMIRTSDNVIGTSDNVIGNVDRFIFLADNLKEIYPNPDVTPELMARAFQAATRRREVTPWPRRLAFVGAALAVAGGAVLGNRIRLAMRLQTIMEKTYSDPNGVPIVSRILRNDGTKKETYHDFQTPKTLAVDADSVVTYVGNQEIHYNRHWKWLIQRGINIGIKQPSLVWLAFNPLIHFDMGTQPEAMLVLQENGSEARFTYDPVTMRLKQRDTFHLIETSNQKKGWVKTETESINELSPANFPTFEQYLPKPIPPLRLQKQLRQELATAKGTHSMVTAVTSKMTALSFDFVSASVNSAGELFFLWHGMPTQPDGAVDDLGRRYIRVPKEAMSEGYFTAWFDPALGRPGAQGVWLIPLHKPDARQATKLTLLFGDRNTDPVQFWNSKTMQVTVPFPKERCATLPDWAAALENVPRSPKELESLRDLALGNEAFLNASTSTIELRHWYERVRAHTYPQRKVATILGIWLSRIRAEEGDGESSRLLYSTHATQGDDRMLRLYADLTLRRCAVWKDVCQPVKEETR